MKKKIITKNKKVENQVPGKLPAEVIPESDRQNTGRHLNYEEIENDLNSKILKITMEIKDHYPELSKYLEEMPETVPSANDPEITLNHLKSYYESLNSLLNKYKVDFPKIEK